MTVDVTNAQRAYPVAVAEVARLARCAIRRLRIRTPGQLAIAFVNPQRMRSLNRQFMGHDRTTDVLAFRYDGEPIVGEVLIAPSAARRYAREHRLDYAQEVSRYVIHGILHWLGHEDHTARQQRTMRDLEDRLLSRCATQHA